MERAVDSGKAIFLDQSGISRADSGLIHCPINCFSWNTSSVTSLFFCSNQLEQLEQLEQLGVRQWAGVPGKRRC